MAYTLNRRLAQLVDSNGQLNTGKIPNDYITSDHVADNTITAAMLHTSFTVAASNLTAIDTDDVSEGSSNLYFTNARVESYLDANGLTLPDNVRAQFGSSNDLRIYHDGSHSRIVENGTGNLIIQGTNLDLTDTTTGETFLRATSNDSVEIYYDGSKKFETSSAGVEVTGTIASGAVTMTNGSLTLSDGYNIQWGGAYSSGNPSISAASNFIVFYPTGNTDGEVIRIDADGIDMNGHNLTEVGNISATGTATVGGTTLANAFEFQVNGDAKITNYIEAAQANFGNTTLTGFLRGPSTFTIDPATHGDDTGTVVIAGNLQVDGTTTTINSTTVNVDDLNITLASGASNAAAANGAGITVDTAGATFTYNGTTDKWEFNRSLKINGPTGGGNPQIEFLNTNGVIRSGKNVAGTGTDTLQLYNNGLGVAVEYGGFVGIGTADPGAKLHIQGNSDSGDEYCQLIIEDTDTDSGSQVPSIQFRADGSNTVRMRGTSAEGLVISGSSAQGDDLVVQASAVGIGTSSPAGSLDVQGTSALFMARTSSGLAAYIENDGGYAKQYLYQLGGGVKIQFNTNGNSYFNGGSLGIGTTSPTADLSVGSTSTSSGDVHLRTTKTTFAITPSNTDAGGTDIDGSFVTGGQGPITFSLNTSEKLRIHSNGNLGINTTAPQSKLEINLHSGADSSLMNANTTNDVQLVRAGYGQNASTTSNAGAKWGLRFVGRNDNNFDTGKSGAIYAVSEDALGYNRQVGLAFHTSPFDAANTERMRITSTGKVGIGETSPDTPLEVKSSGTGESTGIRLTDTNGTIRGNIYFGGAQNFVIHGASAPVGADAPALQFATGGSTPTARMTILEEGNVGIGTPTPDARLDVVGPNGTEVIAARFRKNNYADGAGHTTLIGLGVEAAGWSKSAIGHERITSYDVGDMIFCVNSDASGGTDVSSSDERMRIKSNGNVGIKNDSPGYLLDIGSASSTSSNIFRGTVNGDFIFTLAKNTTNLFSIRNNSTGIVHLNTQNNATLALGVSSTNNTGTIEQTVRIYSNGTMSMTASTAGNGSSIFSTGAYGSGQGDNKTHLGYNNNGTYNNYIRGALTLFSSPIIVENNNDDYSFKARAGDSDSWFGVYDDSNNSANIIVTRSDTTESFKHLGHTGETVIKASGTGLRIESTDTEAIQISGNGGGLNFQTGTNQRIYFNSYRAMEGNNSGSNLQIGEGYSVVNLQAAMVMHGHLTPNTNNAYDLGSSTHVWRDLYIGDLILSNETRKNDDGSTGNSVDGTTGNWTIQEGEEHLYIINNKSGKKYKFALEEIE